VFKDIDSVSDRKERETAYREMRGPGQSAAICFDRGFQKEYKIVASYNRTSWELLKDRAEFRADTFIIMVRSG
jgi:hypothetical protein